MPRSHAACLAGLSVLLLALAFAISPGLYTIDELVYLIGAETMARTGTLSVENGWPAFGSDALKLWFLVDGPNGLAPQYPVGSALLGAPFVWALGPKGLIVLNALAGGAVLWLTYRLSLRLYGQPNAALAAVAILLATTFFADFALAVWPHMLATAFVLGAFLACVHGVDSADQRTANRALALAGALAGLGFLVRADAVLVLPVIGAAILFHARKPIQTGVFTALGLLPSIAVASAANLQKFGTLNPLSYGQAGGGTDPSRYLALAGLLGVGLLLLLALRHVAWRPSWRPALWIGGLALGIAALLVPQIGSPLVTYLDGAYALFVDLRTAHDPRPGVDVMSWGMVSFFGLPKKALGQSLPWIGLIAVLLVARWRPEHRHAHLGLLAFVGLWSLPFVLREWHGGYGLSLRYFIPMLPILACLASALIAGWWAEADRPARRIGLGVAAGLGGFGALHLGLGALPLEIPQLYGAAVLGGVVLTVAGLAMLPVPAQVRAAASLGVAGFALGFASLSGAATDIAETQRLRGIAAETAARASQVPGPVLFYGRPELFPPIAARQDGLLAVPGRLDGAIDPDLVRGALAAGYRVFMTSDNLAELNRQAGPVEQGVALDLAAEPYIEVLGQAAPETTAMR